MKKKAALFCVISLLALTRLAWAESFVPGEALAVFANMSSRSVTASSVTRGPFRARAEAMAASVGARVVRTYGELSQAGDQIFALIRSETRSTEELVRELQKRPDVLAASPNFIVHATRDPDDPGFSGDNLWGLQAISAPWAWDVITGSDDIYVAVMDSGVCISHEDLAANLDRTFSRNFVVEEGQSSPVFSDYEDGNGHGTHVSGIIGAVGNNKLGVVGVNWKVRIITLRVLDDNGVGAISWEIDAINYLLGLLREHPDMKLPAVNLSLGGYDSTTPEDMKTMPEWLAYKLLNDTDRTLIVVAAGNEGLEVGQPAPLDDPWEPALYCKGAFAYPASFVGLKNMIVVGAAVSNGSAAPFSNWSPTAVDLVAPGFDIVSTVFPDAPKGEGTTYGTYYGSMSGTSMATPFVAGAAALLASCTPEYTASQLKDALLQGADQERNPTATAFTNVRAAPLSAFGYLNVNEAMGYLSRKSSSGGGGGCMVGHSGIGLAVVFLVSGMVFLRKRR
ncbi:MAG: hypothetical protein CSA35_04640 [Dethiosulfovibrio peptidovorans]|nr:MAG: hypothetical protein CSA35_04640 [Dethiosulfovibrio peptidovorans]